MSWNDIIFCLKIHPIQQLKISMYGQEPGGLCWCVRFTGDVLNNNFKLSSAYSISWRVQILALIPMKKGENGRKVIITYEIC